MGKIAVFFLSLLTACSATKDNPDPYSAFNRDMLEFNIVVDKNILRPIAYAYKEIVPEIVRYSASNFLLNLKEPFQCLNYTASSDAEHAVNSLFRFVINSTLGIFGLFDVGEQIGLEKSETSYKNTLKKIGVPTGDYLVLPILGSSSTRDAIAEPVSWFVDPVVYFIGFPYMFAKTIVSVVSDRAENSEFVDKSIDDSMDLYSSMKSIYMQKYGDGLLDFGDPQDSPSPD
ncbi:MAG: VacJ family lipoprotein [Holosporaceae bacterium]|jgi:phospholipid-binding lipoprotein MlaA|nr:VacJ family lipoprotein [Holosporaceae bacterium]